MNRSHPKSGVYAVRHAAVLSANLANFMQGKPMQGYAPQPRQLALIRVRETVNDTAPDLSFDERIQQWTIGYTIDGCIDLVPEFCLQARARAPIERCALVDVAGSRWVKLNLHSTVLRVRRRNSS